MVERIKSVILTILILSSLLLSGLLWYKSPSVEEMRRNDYIPQQQIGETRQLAQLVMPRSVIYHTGDGRNFMSFAGDNVYDRVTSALTEVQFTQIEEKKVTRERWEQLLTQLPGWELRFPTAVPIDVLTERLYPGLETTDQLRSVDRIWVYREQQEVNVLFISDFENRVYESQLVVSNGTDSFEQINEVGLLPVTPVTEEHISVNAYEPIKISTHYFPSRDLSMSEWEAPLKEIDLEQMKNLLFLDPSRVRTMTDTEEGTVMMQDGTRSIRYVEADHHLSYQNYKAQLESKPNAYDFHEAVQFINQHGGWMADYQLVNIETRTSENETNHYSFRLVKGGLPVYDREDEVRFGTLMSVESKGGHVLHYDRSLHFTAEEEFMGQRAIPGGSDAQERLLQQVSMTAVRDMFPAYRVTVDDEAKALTYTPGWRIQFTNGDEAWINELLEEGGEADGLE